MLSYLQSHGIHNGGSGSGTYGTVWLDIEGPQYWGSESTNQAFFSALASELKSKGQNVGVYTSASQWEPIMGSFTGGSSFPLWSVSMMMILLLLFFFFFFFFLVSSCRYAHYDNNPSFSDFSPFGGWSKPAMKQFNGDASLCGAGIDENWTPSITAKP